MPQMMPIYWFVIYLSMNVFMYFLVSFYFHNLIFFSILCPKIIKKSFFKGSFFNK